MDKIQECAARFLHLVDTTHMFFIWLKEMCEYHPVGLYLLG